MRHTNTKTLYEYWNTRRLGRNAPGRADIAPKDVSGLLGHLFLLRRIDADHHIFRLAGSALCQMHRREFKDQNFLSLWRGHDRLHMSALLEGALTAPAPATVIVEAHSIDMRSVAVEISILPLRGPEGIVDRVLGLYQPLSGGTLGHRPVVSHEIREIHPASLPAQSVNVFAPLAQARPRARAANDAM